MLGGVFMPVKWALKAVALLFFAIFGPFAGSKLGGGIYLYLVLIHPMIINGIKDDYPLQVAAVQKDVPEALAWIFGYFLVVWVLGVYNIFSREDIEFEERMRDDGYDPRIASEVREYQKYMNEHWTESDWENRRFNRKLHKAAAAVLFPILLVWSFLVWGWIVR